MSVETLGKLSVLDEHGAPVEVSSLWGERTAVLAFVRHFGCLHCRDHVVQLHRSIADIRRTGAELIVIGSGTPSFIAGFRETTGFDGPLFVDPTLATYEAAELERGVLRTLSPRGLGKAVSALRRGVRQGRTQGDAFQQGGVLVIAPGGTLRWRHVSKFAGDNAPVERVVAALA